MDNICKNISCRNLGQKTSCGGITEFPCSPVNLYGASVVEDRRINLDEPTQSSGGSSDYYKLPKDAYEMQDLIEHKQMSFAEGNIFKAIWRLGKKKGADQSYDLKKIIWYAIRLLAARTGRYYTLKECSKEEFHEAWK